MEAPIRVLYLIGGGEFGGAEQHLIGLVNNLDTHQFHPQVAVFYEGEFSARVRRLGIPITVLKSGRKEWGGLHPVRDLINDWRPHVIHTHGVRANLIGRLANRQAGYPARLITTVHSILALDYPMYWKRLLFASFERLTWPFVHHFILVSRAMKEEHLKKGLPESKLSVVHNAIELPEQPQEHVPETSLRELLGVGDDVTIVGTVARLHTVKGHTYLLQAIQKVVAEDQNVVFPWFGDGDLYEELQAEAKALGVERYIKMLGFRQDVPDLLPQLDVFVLPSLSEGLSVALLEALAVGVPAIATAVGGSPEVIDSGEDGLLVPPADPEELAQAICLLVKDKELRLRMAKAGQEMVYRRFTLPRLVRETTDVYKKMIASK
ncbi:glycosyltransferase [Tumebacillus sp. DT12]|uniref:Glycosyltransferase n=1 Tax=Tumebacillus lacus TaxID=2995335 RepID=A0ABT3X0I9_9BACL|nr:glycosyltransferase [Tumebacillus lacus]MCX7569517.1 glycosyltransferase [Tumebacillus lacus]